MNRNPRQRTNVDVLTPAEKRVLQAFADGARGQKGVGQKLNISATTVNDHIISARAKLRATTTTHAIAIAVGNQTIKAPKHDRS